MLKHKNCVIKICSKRGFELKKMLLINKSFICKEKSGTVTKTILVTKNKKHNQLYFGTLVLALNCYCGDNAKNTDFFQNTSFKKTSNMALKKSQSNVNVS